MDWVRFWASSSNLEVEGWDWYSSKTLSRITSKSSCAKVELQQKIAEKKSIKKRRIECFHELKLVKLKIRFKNLPSPISN